MKAIISTVFLALIFVLPVMGQEDDRRDEIKTIFNQEAKASGFGAFDMSLTALNDRFALIMGGHGGLIFNKKLILGFGGYGITTPVRFEGTDPNETLQLSGGYGGIMAGYILNPVEVFHVSIPIFVGIGGMNVDEADFTFDPDNPFLDHTVENSMFVVLEPGIQLEVNITRWFRMGMGLSYRFTEGVDLPRNEITDENTSGLAGNLSFKFGGF